MPLILEGIVTTLNEDQSVNISPMDTSYDAFYAFNEYKAFRKTLFEGIPLLLPLESFSKYDTGIKKLAPYIFQYILGNSVAEYYYPSKISFLAKSPIKPSHTINDLINTIQSTKTYSATDKLAKELAKAHKFNEVFDLIKQIRNAKLRIEPFIDIYRDN